MRGREVVFAGRGRFRASQPRARTGAASAFDVGEARRYHRAIAARRRVPARDHAEEGWRRRRGGTLGAHIAPAGLIARLRAEGRRDRLIDRRSCEFFPSFGAALERAHPGDPLGFQEQRRTGAGGFVRSTAEENDLAVARNLLAASGEIFWSDPGCARDQVRRI